MPFLGIFSTLFVSIFGFGYLLNKINTPTTLLFTGDIMLGRSVMTKSLKVGNPNYPFEKVSDALKNADIVFSNLESPIVKNCPFIDSGLKFCADPKMIDGLKYADISVVNLANNHTLNYGKDGFEQTKKYLNEVGILYVGDNNLVVIEKNKTKFGFLGFNLVDKKISKDELTLIEESKKKVDILVVGVHWGQEYKSIANNFQKNEALKISSAGADYIIGHHPHWTQNIENVGNTRVYYSLGNYIFDQMWSEETKKGMAVKLTFKNKKLFSEEFLKIYMKNFTQPMWID